MKCSNPGKLYASKCAHLPNSASQPPPWLEDSVGSILAGLFISDSRGFGFLTRRKKGLCVTQETGFGLPAGGWGWWSPLWSSGRLGVSPKGEKTTRNRRWVSHKDHWKENSDFLKETSLEMKWDYFNVFSVYLLRNYGVPAMGLRDCISRGDLSMSLCGSAVTRHPLSQALSSGDTERSHRESKFTDQWRRQKMWWKQWLSRMLSAVGVTGERKPPLGLPPLRLGQGSQREVNFTWALKAKSKSKQIRMKKSFKSGSSLCMRGWAAQCYSRIGRRCRGGGDRGEMVVEGWLFPSCWPHTLLFIVPMSKKQSLSSSPGS